MIGIDLESLPIYRIAFQQYLIRELRGIGGIEIGSYEEGKEYDLVITFCQRNKNSVNIICQNLRHLTTLFD